MAAPPPIAPGQDLLAVPNGDLADGLSGWGAVGPSLELVGGPLVQAADNTSVVTPPVTVPATGQSLPVRLGVPGANALLDVRARPLDGGPEVALGTYRAQCAHSRDAQAWRLPKRVVARTTRHVGCAYAL
ncbi:MAG: hypothetical protein ACPG7S_07100, partial [Miltoncostaeaceae bacterium]